MKTALKGFGLGVAAFGVAGMAHAAPVTFEATGVISGTDGQGVVGLPGFFSSNNATIRWTWDTDTVTGEYSDNPLEFSNALTSFQVEVGGTVIEFINEQTTENLVSAYQGDFGGADAIGDDVLLLESRSVVNGQNAFASLNWIFEDNGLGDLDPATLANADGVGLGAGSFSLDINDPTFGIVPFQFDIDVNEVTFAFAPVEEAPVAVPTPAALGGVVLLAPLMMKRRRNNR